MAQESPDSGGIYHWSGDEMLSKYDMALAMGRAFNLPTSHLRPINDEPIGAAVNRPKDAHLSSGRLRRIDGMANKWSFNNAIEVCYAKFVPGYISIL